LRKREKGKKETKTTSPWDVGGKKIGIVFDAKKKRSEKEGGRKWMVARTKPHGKKSEKALC